MGVQLQGVSLYPIHPTGLEETTPAASQGQGMETISIQDQMCPPHPQTKGQVHFPNFWSQRSPQVQAILLFFSLLPYLKSSDKCILTGGEIMDQPNP